MLRYPLYSDQPWAETYSEILDVRSPSEYAEDHLPGAINLPVLDDAQRAEVGTLYKQVDPFAARKVGAALVSQNISRALDQHFADKPKDYRPLIYCWRGGQRSRSMALVLAEIGWPVTLLQGGYKTYRAWVRQQLVDLPGRFGYRILCGPTGSGKTELLRHLETGGEQVLDLEGLARHRGSLLGQEWQVPQPSQKYFETLVLQRLRSFRVERPVWLESESAKVGSVYVPAVLWQEMMRADCVEIQVPLRSRIAWLIQNYPHFIAHPEVLKAKLLDLKQRHGQAVLSQWFDWIDAQQWDPFVADLLERHYDPTYGHALRQSFSRISQTVALPDLSPASFEQAVAELLPTKDPYPSSSQSSLAAARNHP